VHDGIENISEFVVPRVDKTNPFAEGFKASPGVVQSFAVAVNTEDPQSWSARQKSFGVTAKTEGRIYQQWAGPVECRQKKLEASLP
jgi:hypothetical protein